MSISIFLPFVAHRALEYQNQWYLPKQPRQYLLPASSSAVESGIRVIGPCRRTSELTSILASTPVIPAKACPLDFLSFTPPLAAHSSSLPNALLVSPPAHGRATSFEEKAQALLLAHKARLHLARPTSPAAPLPILLPASTLLVSFTSSNSGEFLQITCCSL